MLFNSYSARFKKLARFQDLSFFEVPERARHQSNSGARYFPIAKENNVWGQVDNRKLVLFSDILAKGGVERILSYMSLNLLSDDDHIVLYDKSRIDFPFGGKLLNLDLEPPPYDNLFKEIYILIKSILKIRQVKKRFNVSFCISFKEGPNFANVITSFSNTIVTVHEYKTSGIRFKGIIAKFVKVLIKILYNRATSVVTVSRAIAKDLVDNFGVKEKKITVIYNPCNTQDIEDRLKEKLGGPHNEIFKIPVIINVGRLSTQKGQWHLIRAFKSVKVRQKNINLVFLGEGEEDGYLRDISKKLNIEENVHFLGFQKNPFKYIGKSSLFVLSSLWEGFPGVLLESMACNTAIISTDCKSGPRELLAPDTNIEYQTKDIEYAKYGILVPPLDGQYKKASDPLTENEELLAKAINILLDDSSMLRNYSVLGYKRVLEFSMKRFIGEWNRLLDEIQ